MAAPRPSDSFFVGYINAVPRPLATFLMLFTAAFLGAMAGLALAIGAGTDDPGDGRFDFASGRQELTGTLSARPYPVLHVPATGGQPARAILLAGQGKRGVIEEAAALDGRAVQAGGVMIRRGSIDMLQIGGQNGLAAAGDDAPAAIAAPVVLGRWRLTGEICDGKCYLGAMRPGRGLAHKACANLCLIGGVPPVFVASGPVEGETFFLLADVDGGPVPDTLYDLVGLYIEIEGEIERRDGLTIFRVDLSGARAL